MPPIRRTSSRSQSPKQQKSNQLPSKGDDDPEEEEFDDSEDDFRDDIDLDDDPVNTFGQDPNFNQAVAKGQYIRVHFLKPLKEHIKDSTLMPDTKATLVIMAEGLFDKTQVLAKRKNLKLSEIGMEIMLAQARFGFHPVDVDNPDLSNITNLIKDLYNAFISRSENGWERELDNRMETSHTQSINDNRFHQPQMPQKSQYPAWHYKRWF